MEAIRKFLANCKVSKTRVHVVGANSSYANVLALHPQSTLLVAMFRKLIGRRMQATCSYETLLPSVEEDLPQDLY